MNGGIRWKKRWWLVCAAAVVLAGLLLAAKGRGEAKGPGMPFRLGRVQVEELQVSVREVGMVDPYSKVEVKSAVSGRVVTIAVREGAQVRRGQVLAEVEPDVTQAQTLSEVQAGLSRARVDFLNSDKDYAQHAALHRQGVVSEQTYRKAKVDRDLKEETLKAALTRYQVVEDRGIPISGNASTQLARISSPLDGVVIKKGVELGDTITSGVSSYNAGTAIVTVADLKSLIVRVNLNEVDIGKVQVGQPARITLDAYPQQTFTGQVRFVAPAAELVEKIKVFRLEVALDRLEDCFRTGMSANVEILGERRASAVSVPLEALQRREGLPVVYRLKRELTPKALNAAREGLAGRSRFVWLSDHWQDYFEVVPVKAGIATLERVEILAGLAGNDEVCLEDPTRKRVEKDEDY
jgi:RND family efflux transporter MFP subunit